MYRAGIWDGKWTGKDEKTGKREIGARDGKMGRDSVPISRFLVHFPFFFKVYLYRAWTLWRSFSPTPLSQQQSYLSFVLVQVQELHVFVRPVELHHTGK
jgi:hypothetical protein